MLGIPTAHARVTRPQPAMKYHPIFLVGAFALLALPSCSMVKELRQTASNGVYDSAIGGLLPSRVKVVSVRASDLKDMPLGHDRAMAFQQTQTHRGGFFGLFSGPVDFKEPKLPNAGAALDGTLLPPKSVQ